MYISKRQLGAAIIVILILSGAIVSAREPVAMGRMLVERTTASSVVSPLLQYQGRLTDPASGEDVADGTYEMSFRLYDRPSGGSPLWSEIKDVPVQGGLFSTALGDTAMLSQSLFDGRALWLGVKVGADEETVPRQQVQPVAYALGLVPGANVSANGAAASFTVGNSGSGPALRAVGRVAVSGDLSVDGTLIGGDHTHAGYVTQYEMDDHIYGGMHSGRYLAAGIIHEDGTIATATANVSSKWSALHKAYEITIDGVNYDHWSHVTVVTPIVGGFTSAWGNAGKLYIGIYDTDTKPVQQPFQFVVFQP